MARLIVSVNATVNQPVSDSLPHIDSTSFNVGGTECNYVQVGSIEGFVFDFSKVINSAVISIDTSFGLKFNNNKDFTELNVSY